MTTMETIGAVQDVFGGADAPVAPAGETAPAAVAVPDSANASVPPKAAEPAKAEAKADGKAEAGSLLGAAAAAPKYEFKAEGMHADELKLFADVLGEHKADGKLGQAILDKMLPALNARREKEVAESWDKIVKEWGAENAKHPETDPSNPENAARVKAALAIAGDDVLDELKGRRLLDLPAFNRFAVRVGAFIEKATKQDNAIPGSSPAKATWAAGDTSAIAFAEGLYQ